MKKDQIFIITKNGSELNLSILRENLPWLRNKKWMKSTWKHKTALIDKKSGSMRLYIGQEFNDKDFEIKPGAWLHDHCDLCTTGIFENDIIYISEYEMICEECYLNFAEPEDVELRIRQLKQILK